MKIDVCWEIGIKWYFYKNAELLKNTQGKLLKNLMDNL